MSFVGVGGFALREYLLVGLVCRPGERQHLPVDVDGGEVGYVDVPVGINIYYDLIPSEFPQCNSHFPHGLGAGVGELVGHGRHEEGGVGAEAAGYRRLLHFLACMRGSQRFFTYWL